MPPVSAVLIRPLLLLALAAPAAAQNRAPPPPAFEIVEATIPELQAAMAAGRVTAAGLVDAYLARIAAYDTAGPALDAIIRVNPDARAEAERLDRERAAGRVRGPLHGIPVILKDNFDVAGLPTSGGSIALAGLIPPDDAFQVQRLREAGAVILAKSNLHEFAAGITTISSLGGQTRNPYDPRRNPGGSSGGTAAAVASNFGAIGWGTDTCGSIRIPAALNNLWGLRPTKGLSSIDGIIPLAATQDVAGPLARTATDLAIGLDATVGPDPADPATRILAGRGVPDFTAALASASLRGARIGVLDAYFGDAPEDEEVGDVVRAALDSMQAAGAELIPVAIAALDSLLEGTSLISWEFKFDLNDYLAATPGAPVGSLGEVLESGMFNAELEERFRQRNARESRDTDEYRALLERREKVRALVLHAFDEHRIDALAYPSIRRKAAIIGEPARGANCQLSATTGMPALSIPAGFTEDGLPVGLELLGRPLDDARLLAIGYAFEQAGDQRRAPSRTPPLRNGNRPAPIAIEVLATADSLASPGNSPAVASASFSFNAARSTLAYRVTVRGVAAANVHAIALHRGAPGERGAVIHRLAGPGRAAAAGTIELSNQERQALLAGELYLQLYTREHPAGAARGPLRIR